MEYQITIHNPQTAESQTRELSPNRTYTLGNSEANNIQLSHPFVAVEHARLEVTVDALILTDLGSANGTFVQNHRIPAHEPISLQPGDVIDIALFQITVALAVTSEVETEESPDNQDQDALLDPMTELGTEESLDEEDDPAATAEDGESPPMAVKLSNGRDPDYWQQAEAIGLLPNHSRYVQYLPALYDTPFMHRFLGLFESLLAPIVWRIDSLDLYLDPCTTPAEFLSWLASWYSFTFDHTWDEDKRRRLLHIAPQIYKCWGTCWALQRVLEVYTVQDKVTIIDDERMPAFTFRIEIGLPESETLRGGVERLINAHKPAHTSYELLFTG